MKKWSPLRAPGRRNQFHEFTAQAGLIDGSEFRLSGGHRLRAWTEVERTCFPDTQPIEAMTALSVNLS